MDGSDASTSRASSTSRRAFACTISTSAAPARRCSFSPGSATPRTRSTISRRRSPTGFTSSRSRAAASASRRTRDSGYDTPRLVEDIRAALERLHLGRVILIGHSIAGEEMTLSRGEASRSRCRSSSISTPRTIASLGDSLIDEVFAVPPDVPARPQPSAADTATAAGYVEFVHRTRGVNIPESDIRARYRVRRMERGDHRRLSIDRRGASQLSRGARARAGDLRGDRHRHAARAVAAHRPRARGGAPGDDSRHRVRA